jgi:hypothetical protein
VTGRLIAGLALIALGALFLLGELDVVEDPGAVVAAWWPMVLVGVGIGLVAEQRRLGAGPLLFIGIGAVLLAATTGAVPLEARIVWPLLLVAAGAWLLFHAGTWRRKDNKVSDARVAATAIFGDRNLRSADAAFEQASLTAIFGDIDLDLRDAKPGEGMTVDLTVIFGDVDVIAPADWRVVLATSSLLADVKHRPPPQPPAADAPLLRVRGLTLLGDVKVQQ